MAKKKVKAEPVPASIPEIYDRLEDLYKETENGFNGGRQYNQTSYAGLVLLVMDNEIRLEDQLAPGLPWWKAMEFFAWCEKRGWRWYHMVEELADGGWIMTWSEPGDYDRDKEEEQWSLVEEMLGDSEFLRRWAEIAKYSPNRGDEGSSASVFLHWPSPDELTEEPETKTKES